MKIKIAIVLFFSIVSAWGNYPLQPKKLNYAKLNAQAEKEYLTPIRPITEGKNPCWTGYAVKFTYAPTFEFKEVEGAKNYRFTITANMDVYETINGKKLKIINNNFKPISFITDKPTNSLSPIWKKLPASHVILTIEALDAQGKVIQKVGERKFFRDFPFKGPYSNNPLPYKESAIKGMLHIHNMPEVACWADSAMPNMNYQHYTYLNKCVSAVICNEVLVAKYVPSERERAIRMAENVAKFISSMSQPEGAPLAYFPPTYYKDLIASKRAENQGTMITTDALMAAQAFLDLYDITKKAEYLERVKNIMRTYKKIQSAEGSIPIKVYIATGKPSSNRKAMLHPLCEMAERLSKYYGINEFKEMQAKAEKWMHEVPIKSFDMTSQFEDVSVIDIKPYNNLTNCTSATYARYLYLKDHPSKEDLEDARDLMKLSEDQFTYWDWLYNENGYRRLPTPCVIEQYHYKTPVDHSAASVSGGFLAYYKLTGDPLAFAKAKAIIDNITIQQVHKNGYMPTTWDFAHKRTQELSMWLNCANAAINRLLEMSELCGEGKSLATRNFQ